MKKRDWVIIGCIIVGGIVIACLINWSLTYGSWIKTNLSIDSWLSFWGSYCGGIFATIVGYLAIIYSNRNSEKAILQQEKQLIHQRIVKKLDEYNDCLKNNLELLNIVDIMGITVGIDYQNLSLAKKDVCRKKAQIYATDLQYRYVFEVDVPRAKTDLEVQYDKVWVNLRSKLSSLLDEELDLIERINQNHYDIQLKENHQQRLHLISEILKQADDTTRREEYLHDKQSITQELEQLDKRINSYYKEVDTMLLSLKSSADQLNADTKLLFDLSILLLKEKERELKD
jgi:hypothetical protein